MRDVTCSVRPRIGPDIMKPTTQNISLGAEYLYTNLGGNDFRANLAGAGGGGPFGAGTTGFGTSDDFDLHTVRVKLSYRF